MHSITYPDLTVFKIPISCVKHFDIEGGLVLVYQAADTKSAGLSVRDIGMELLKMLHSAGMAVEDPIDVISKIAAQDVIKKNIIDGILSLPQIYVQVTKAGTNDGASPAPDQTQVVEYALWISIELDEDRKQALRDAFPVVLNPLFLKIWSTTNDALLTDMDISQIERLLQFDESQGSRF